MCGALLVRLTRRKLFTWRVWYLGSIDHDDFDESILLRVIPFVPHLPPKHSTRKFNCSTFSTLCIAGMRMLDMFLDDFLDKCEPFHPLGKQGSQRSAGFQGREASLVAQ